MATSIDPALVRRLASLARLNLSDNEVDGAVDHLTRFLEHADQLNEVEVERQDAEMLAVEGRPATPLRDDIVQVGDGQADAMANSPRSLDGFYVVPRVLK